MGFGNPMGGNYAIHQVIFSRQPRRRVWRVLVRGAYPSPPAWSRPPVPRLSALSRQMESLVGESWGPDGESLESLQGTLSNPCTGSDLGRDGKTESCLLYTSDAADE